MIPKTRNIHLLWYLILTCLSTQSYDYEWAVVGAGPAGVIAVGVLLELHVPPSHIVWIDPEFNVGRLGKYYENVPANSRAQEMAAFIKSCEAFRACDSPSLQALLNYPTYAEFLLHMIAHPLKDIAHHMMQRGIHSTQDTLIQLDHEYHAWHLITTHNSYSAKRVILALGAEPIELDYPVPVVIPLDSALDKQKLTQLIDPDDTIAVVGSGASAILLLKYLSEIPVRQVINFYKHHHAIARRKSLIRGITADWIKNVLEKRPPANLLRITNTPENRDLYLPQCTKIIYALGYKRNVMPINGPWEIPSPNRTGILGPGLFGIGFAFPEEITYPSTQGTVTVPLVGVTSFMTFAKRVMPQWFAY